MRDQLMTKGNDLGLHCNSASQEGEKGTEHHYYKVGNGRSSLTADICSFNNSKADEVFSNHSRKTIHPDAGGAMFGRRQNYGCGEAPAVEGGDVAGPRILPSPSTAPTIRPYGRPSLNGSTVILT
jgi:hypothetical protein